MFILPEYCFDCVQAVWPAIIAAAASLGSAIYGNEASKSNSQRAFDAEKDYSRWLLSNGTQEKVKDMRAAGLSPAFENGSQLGAAPPAPSYTAPTFAAPNDLSSAILGGLRNEAEIDLLKAQKNNIVEDTQKKKIENNYLPALMEKQISLVGSSIDLNVSSANLNEEKAKEVSQAISESEMRISQIVGNLNILRKQTEILSHEERIKAVEAMFKSDEMQAQIANLAASANLSSAQATDIYKTMAARIANIESDTKLKGHQSSLVSWQSQSQRLQFNLDSDYSEPERIVGIINGGVNALEQVSNTFLNFLPAGKAAKFAKTMKNVSPARPNPISGFGR